MASVYDNIDLRFSWNGDFALDGNHDLKDTSDDGLESLLQDIHTVAASAFQDWEIYPNLGAGLDDYVGEPNIRRVGNAISERLSLSLVSAGVVFEDDLNIRVMPVHAHKVFAIITVNAVPTPFNKLEENAFLQTQLVFDFVEQGIYFPEKTPDLLGG